MMKNLPQTKQNACTAGWHVANPGLSLRVPRRLRLCVLLLFLSLYSLSVGAPPPVFAQTSAPGGVSSNLVLWLNDSSIAAVTPGPSPYEGTIAFWSDLSPTGHHATQNTEALRPAFGAGLNFHPTVKFDGVDDFVTVPGGVLRTGCCGGPSAPGTFDGVTVFLVHRYDSTLATKVIADVFEEPTINKTNFGAVDAYLHSSGSFCHGYTGLGGHGDDLCTPAGLLSPNTPYLWSLRYSPREAILNGLSKAVGGDIPNLQGGGADFQIARGSQSFPGYNLYYGGDIAELIVYTADLTPAQRRSVESYLALKWGLTLGDSSTPISYTSSSGVVAWNGPANSGYHHDVAGIGRDDGSALDQRKSQSSNAGAPLRVDYGSAFSIDQSFLVWGDDGSAAMLTSGYNGGATNRITRVWRVAEIGSVGPVTVTVPASIDGLLQNLLVHSSDPTFGTVERSFPVTVNNAYYQVVVDFNPGDYFTFGGQPGGGDADQDGIPTIVEDANQDGDPANDDADGDGHPNYLDADSDGDGIPDRVEAGADPLQPLNTDGDALPDYLDLDSDNDDMDDVYEAGGVDLNGDGRQDSVGDGNDDADGDGLVDRVDPDEGGAALPLLDWNNDGTPNYQDANSLKLYVDSYLVGCGGTWSLYPCERTKEGVNGAWYGQDEPIAGFTYEPGYAYALYVSKRWVFQQGCMDDCPRYEWTLLAQITKTLALSPDGDNDFDDANDVVEDRNGDGDPYNDDSDGDLTPDFLDGDDDGDDIATGPGFLYFYDSTPPLIQEDRNGNGNPTDDDSDSDGTPDYLDTDDDGDLIATLAEGAGDSDGDGTADYLDPDSGAATVNLEVASYWQKCYGFGLRTCLYVREAPSPTWQLFYDGIEGFTYAPGYAYALSVRKEVVPNPPADASSLRWILLAEISKTVMASPAGDNDFDGASDALEDRNHDNNPTNDDSDGDGTPDFLDLDDDGDGINTGLGMVDFIPLPGERVGEDGNGNGRPNDDDTDGDGTPDYLDTDDDGDTMLTVQEGTSDSDSDGTPNYLDADDDNDGLLTSQEGTTNTDGDDQPNYLDSDDDGDGILTPGEDRNGDGNPTNDDADQDGTPDYLDPDPVTDFDGDGQPDNVDTDDDNDGLSDSEEGDGAVDTDHDGTPDSRDTDADGDGRTDRTECPSGGSCPDSDGNGLPDYRDPQSPLDSDQDTLPNFTDPDDDNDGIADTVECPGSVPAGPCPDTDGDGVPDSLDTDSDADGVADRFECTSGVPAGSCPDRDGDGLPNYRDRDDDGDGILTPGEDRNGDGNPTNDDADGDGLADYLDSDPVTDFDGDGQPDHVDLDDDDDGIADSVEGDGTVDTDHDGTPDSRDTDSDDDGLNDASECPSGVTAEPCRDLDSNGTPDYRDPSQPLDSDGDGAPNLIDLDDDGDGLVDSVECPSAVPTAPCPDSDGDGTSDSLDLDSDNDQVLDATECPSAATAGACRNTDGDSLPDYRDPDDDGDGSPTASEVPNGDSDGDGIPDFLDPDPALDSDQDGKPDASDPDDDGDGLLDSSEGSVDTDGDGTPDALDLDSDGDGLPDSTESIAAGNAASVTSTQAGVDTDGDGYPDYRDLDSDDDGIDDATEGGGSDADGDGLIDVLLTSPTDTDGDGTPDYRDLDSNNNGVFDLVEHGASALDPNGDGRVDGVDSDGDGIKDSVDGAPTSYGDAPAALLPNGVYLPIITKD